MKILIIQNPDGSYEVYSEEKVAVHSVQRLNTTGNCAYSVAECVLENDIPKSYRQCYFPGNLKYQGVIDDGDISKRLVKECELTALRGLDCYLTSQESDSTSAM